MSYGHTQQAKGFSEYPNSGTVKIAVTMPREHFEYMKLKALKNGWSISEVIRAYIETGIIVDREIEEQWPTEGAGSAGQG